MRGQPPSRYDTSQMLHESDAKIPLFRSIPGWDKDVRANAFKFFPGILHPEEASAESVEFIQGLQQDARAPTEFARYDDGTPILFHTDKDGRPLTRKAMVNVVRDYFRLHYGAQCPAAV